MEFEWDYRVLFEKRGKFSCFFVWIIGTNDQTNEEVTIKLVGYLDYPREFSFIDKIDLNCSPLKWSHGFIASQVCQIL